MSEVGGKTGLEGKNGLPVKKESSFKRVIQRFSKVGRNADRILDHALLYAFADIRRERVERGFNLEGAVREVEGPIIEVGGPTDRSWYLTDIKNANRQMFISNITPGNPVHDNKNGSNQAFKYEGKVDFLADAGQLPLGNKSVGVLFASCLTRDIWEGFFREAHRVVKDNALVVAAGLGEEGIQMAEESGFKTAELIRYKGRLAHEVRYDAVFRNLADQEARSGT